MRHIYFWTRLFRMTRYAIKWWWQRRRRGWDDRDAWDLAGATAKFMLPRLRHFRRHGTGHPFGVTPDEWDAILGDIIYAMRASATEAGCKKDVLKSIDWDRANQGYRLLGRHFRSMWD